MKILKELSEQRHFFLIILFNEKSNKIVLEFLLVKYSMGFQLLDTRNVQRL